MTDQSERKHFTFWDVMAIAGTVIGGGTFVLPVDLVGAWFFWSAFILIITWFPTSRSGLLLLEANLDHLVGSSFNTITKDLIGSTWNIIGDITVAFVLYILTYAYTSANGMTISETISMNLGYHVNPRIVGIYTVTFATNVLWISSLAASCTTSLFPGPKIISFVIVFGSFFFQVNYPILCGSASTTAGTSYFSYVFMTLPVCLASFGPHDNIPNPIICYGKERGKLIKSVVFGSLSALMTYLFRLYCMMGNIPRENFKVMILSGGNVDSLVKSFLGTKQHGIIESCLPVFSNLAVANSFFGITLELFDYLTDLFKIGNSHGGCFKTVLLTFLPPALLYLIFPNGFIYGIGGARLCATIWAVIIPAVLAVKVRKKFPNQMLTVQGGSLIPAIVILLGITVILYWLGSVFNVLPKFG